MPCEAASNKEPPSTLADDLARLAAERSPDKRVELLRRIAEAYATHDEAPVATERYLFNEVVSKLVDKLRGADRAAASGTLAAMKKLPDGLVRALASDTDIAVARPMIRDYKAMPERILVDIARTGSQEHLRVIAVRDKVTPPVTDVVVERGDTTVVGILAANNGARFSRCGHAPSGRQGQGRSSLAGPAGRSQRSAGERDPRSAADDQRGNGAAAA